ncbi:protein trichome birefringence-like 2 [Papaver somniferum]|uniref:protein trichome birefringence-like 2 n=1 Tax=Papaver somniferum TaxID=3469 RepID=UPI000E6F8068|nr:protein trichome birefringence-like 2 [Papaver somniferum]
MATDILAMPVSSVASESAFSTGKRVLTPWRASLSTRTVEALLCTQSFLQKPIALDILCDYIPDDAVEDEAGKNPAPEWNRTGLTGKRTSPGTSPQIEELDQRRSLVLQFLIGRNCNEQDTPCVIQFSLIRLGVALIIAGLDAKLAILLQNICVTVPDYPPGSCPYVVEGSNFDCGKNGRTDHQFLKWRWQWLSAGCDSNIPRNLNATDFLERLRGKKVAFAGDSLNRNMFSSLACIFWNVVPDKSKVYWLQGGALSVRFEDYNCTVGFVPSPFLVYKTIPQSKSKQELVTMRLDLIDPRASLFYRDADVVVFNSWHWWAKNKVHNGTNYFQEGDYLYPTLEINKAFKKALSTRGKWIDNNIDSNKTQVVFRGHSISHFVGGPWNKGGRCDGVTEPLTSKETFKEKNPSGVKSIEDTLRQMKTPVIYLNITKEGCRFPINRSKEASHRNLVCAFGVLLGNPLWFFCFCFVVSEFWPCPPSCFALALLLLFLFFILSIIFLTFFPWKKVQ